MFIIDFDGTIYDTHLFIKDIYDVLIRFGVSVIDANKTMKTAILLEGNLHYGYTFDRQLDDLLDLGYVFDRGQVLGSLMSITENKDYTSKDAIIFLEKLKTFGLPLVLLTAGDKTFQMMKFESTQMPLYFDTVECVFGDKDKYVESVYTKGQQIFFINDKELENIEVKKSCPAAEVVTKHNPYKVVANTGEDFGLPTFESLLDIATYVREKIS